MNCWRSGLSNPKFRLEKMLYAAKNPRTHRRAAFSLAELVISIGILVLMMALAGQVFSITIKSTGQATALTEVTQQLRMLEDNLREDLRNIPRGQSVLYIEANPLKAYWTQLGKDADDDNDPSNGYGSIRDLEREKFDSTGAAVLTATGNPVLTEPRADLLMFFTARKGTSFVDPKISSRVQQVVYGHAEMGTYDMSTASPTLQATSFPTADKSFDVPAQQWHLARRSVLLLPTPLSAACDWEGLKAAAPAGGGLGNPNFLDGQRDYVCNFRYDDLVVRPWDDKSNWDSKTPWFLPAIFGNTAGLPLHTPFARSRMDANPPMLMSNRMGAFFLPNCASFKVEWALDPQSPFVNGRLNGTSEVFWIDHGNSMGGSNFPSGMDPLYSIQKRIDELATKPSSDKAAQVLKANLQSLLCDRVVHADGSFYSLADRFRGVACDGDPDAPWVQLSSDGKRPSIAVFTAMRPHENYAQTGELAPDDMWPSALRITVDLYDRESRLQRPIRHVMVIPIGG